MSGQLVTATLVFAAMHTVSAAFISVFYHRGLAHGAVTLPPRTRRFVAACGTWITGIDPKAWVCMHRLHHAFSDREGDPHSPVQVGVRGVLLAQLRGYERALRGLLSRHPAYCDRVADLELDVASLYRRGRWWLPHATHAAIATAIGLMFGAPIGVAYFAGLMAHPLQGWAINGLGHAIGRRNFDTPDHSRNNWITALLVVGEGLQNNHHHRPHSAKFSVHWWEPDLGYRLCRILARLHVLHIDRDHDGGGVDRTFRASATRGNMDACTDAEQSRSA